MDSVSHTGGHLASNLGVVELAVALEREFDSSRDRIVYDVGHQSYVHKILTGRRDRFDTLRQYGGISGFMKPEESITDPCITGHVIGDGAMTGGMAYEALNSAGTSGEPLLVILNDNNMSIARNVGGLSRHLSRLRVSPRYLHAKTHVKDCLARIPGGAVVTRLISRCKARLKRIFLPATLFEQMGFTYFGPVDGHDLKSVCELLAQVKNMKKPVLLHVMTQKGRGYAPSEQHPEAYHGVSPFDAEEGLDHVQGKKDFSACMGETLCELAEKDARICAVTAAMPSGTGLTDFSARFPDRFFDVGIAEEHAVAMAAGMAAQGLIPVAAIYSTFLQRAYDQIVHDVAIAHLHVIFCVDRAGIVGADGATHNGVLDIAFLRSVPGVKIFLPANFAELRSMLSRAIYHEDGPVAIRYPRGGEGAFCTDTTELDVVRVREAAQPMVSLLTYGTMIEQALEAAELLEKRQIFAEVWKLNALDDNIEQTLTELAGQLTDWCVVIEDVVQSGGIGELIAACHKGRTDLLNTGNRFLPHGSVQEIYRHCGIDAESIADFICQEKGKGETAHG